MEDVEKVALFKTSNAFNPKYYSQKSRSGGDTNKGGILLIKPNETIKQPAVVGGGNLKRQQHKLSCPDLVGGEGKMRDRKKC